MNDTVRYSNAMVANKAVYLKDAQKYEEELATLAAGPGNTDTQDATTPPSDKPTDADKVWEKRYADLKSYMDKKINEVTSKADSVQQENQNLKQQLKDAHNKPKSYPVSDAELDEWASRYPEFEKILDTYIEKRLDVRSSTLHDEMKRIEEQTKAFAAERGRQELLKYHPDANELETDPKFVSWYQEQEDEIKSLFKSTDPKKISKGLDIYKKFAGIERTKGADRDKEASKAVTIPSKAEIPQEKKVWKESEINKMHIKTYQKLESELEKARKEGRIEYDLSVVNER